MLANLSLKEIGNFLNKLAEKSDSVYWLSSPDFQHIIYISPAYESIWGRGRAELYQTPEVWINYLHPADRQGGRHPIHSMAQRLNEQGEKARYDEKYRIVRPDGSVRWILDRGFPIYDDQGHCVGVTGVAVDITAEKETEQLRIENEAHKAQIQEHEKFAKIADQVAHDIRSPIASLLMIVKACTDIPESDRVGLREAAIQIEDIANNLLNKYQKKEELAPNKQEEQQPTLVSALLLQLLADKRYLHQRTKIKFSHDFTQAGLFAFIAVEPTSLKRAISNMLNNAVEAIEQQEGKIIIKLDATEHQVKLIIQDTGKGMSPELVDTILKNVAITEGKTTGHGIGLTQVRETLQRNQGTFAINSIVDIGTQITLTFPRITAPAWMASSLTVGHQDIVIIVDDDTSIHTAWDAHFEAFMLKFPELQLKHFTHGEEALAFVDSLSAKDRQRVFLLTDYELLKQPLNGLDIIARAQGIPSVLVTSHYANISIQQQAVAQHTTIIPKQLASETPIHIVTADTKTPEPAPTLEIVDLIFVDDDPDFIELAISSLFSQKRTQHYLSPSALFKAVSKYPKDTKILLDNRFANDHLNGVEAAQQLHELGFTRLYLFSGDRFGQGDVPAYLTVIPKTAIDQLKAVGNS